MARRALTEHEAALIRANPDLGWHSDTMSEAMDWRRPKADPVVRRPAATVAAYAAAALMGIVTGHLFANMLFGG